MGFYTALIPKYFDILLLEFSSPSSAGIINQHPIQDIQLDSLSTKYSKERDRMLQKKTLYIPFTFLLIIATVQLALVSRMVAFLHIQKTEVGTYRILRNSTSTDGSINGGGFDLHVLPEKLSLNQGHVTNGAAGYGVVMSIASLVACVFLRRDAYQKVCPSPNLFYQTMKADDRKRHKSILLTLTIALFLLVLFILTAFTYVAAVTYLTMDNKIDLDVAQAAASAGPGVGYGIDSWTPETWYQALVLLPLDESTKSNLSAAVSEMVAWRAWVTLYQVVAAVVLGWTGMVYLREWRRVCGCRLASGSRIGADRAEEEELVTYRVGFAEGGRK